MLAGTLKVDGILVKCSDLSRSSVLDSAASRAVSHPLHPPTTPEGDSQREHVAWLQGADAGSASDREMGALYSWAAHRVAGYVDALGRHLGRLQEGGALASVLEHAMYCGMSLARAGLDLRPLLVPVFEAGVLELFARSTQVGLSEDLCL